VLDDTCPTEKRKHGVGITPMQGQASRRIADPDRKSVRLNKPSTLNLTYSLVKEHKKLPPSADEIVLQQSREQTHASLTFFPSPAARQ